MKRTIIAAVLAALSSATAHAAPSRWALDVNTVSYHTEAWARHSLNQDNPGMGLEYQATPDWSALAGFYKNSYRHTTGYALAAWTPLRVDLPAGLRAGAGIAAGLVSGYSRSEVPTSPLAAGAVLRIRDPRGFGINLLAVPNTTSGSGFVGLQIVIPIR
jgi:opacity protein-like surface antigen